MSSSNPGAEWLAVIEDDRPIRGVFGDEEPGLDGSRLVRASWSTRGSVSQVVLGLALPLFPADPPKKYARNNTIDIDLTFDLVHEFRVDGVADERPGRVELVRLAHDQVRLTFANDTSDVDVAAEFVAVSKIRSYIHDEFTPPI